MPDITIATWNIEWMNRLFEKNKPKEDEASAERFQQIKQVIESINPDILIIQEGPNEYPEMTLFVTNYLNDQFSCVRASLRDKNPVTNKAFSDTQLIWSLCKKGTNLKQNEVKHSEHEGPFQDWKKIIDPDFGEETFFHHRIPVEVEINFDDGTRSKGPIKVLGLHPKSKKTMKGGSAGEAEAAENRRKLLAQGINIRKYIDGLLEADPKRNIIICGDLNDGIGLDKFEYLLGGDIAGLITGNVRMPHLVFKNALEKEIIENLEKPGTHHTIKFGAEGPYERILIDHILFSPSFKSGDIAFVHESGKIRSDLIQRFPKASDHNPVEARIKIDL